MSPGKSTSWSKGFIAQRKATKSFDEDTLLLNLTDPQFLLECATNRQSSKTEQLQTLLTQCNDLFSVCSEPVTLLSRLLFSPAESRTGLLGLSATKTITGVDELNVCSLVENIIETLMTQGWFKSIIHFSQFHRLQQGRCSLLSIEVIDWVTKKNGLLDLIQRRSDSAVLLLYFFLSNHYEGASQVWSAIHFLSVDKIRDLCDSLVGYLMRGSLVESNEAILGTFVFHLLKQLVEILQWYVPIVGAGEDISSDQVIQSLQAFSGKYNTPLQPSLFIPPSNFN